MIVFGLYNISANAQNKRRAGAIRIENRA